MTDSEWRETAPGEILPDAAELDALIVEPGLELAAHEVYLDLASPGQGPFRALPGQTAGSGNRYIAETTVAPAIWHALVRRDAADAVTRGVSPDPSVTS